MPDPPPCPTCQRLLGPTFSFDHFSAEDCNEGIHVEGDAWAEMGEVHIKRTKTGVVTKDAARVDIDDLDIS